MTDTSQLDAELQNNEANRANEGPWFRSPLALVAGFILFLGILALIVLAVTGGDDSEPAADAVSAPNAPAEQADPIAFGGADVPEVDVVLFEGEQLPRLEPGEADPAVGMQSPVITATSLANGSPITLTSGRARVIGFFAHWCSHCQRELPELTAWLAENSLPPNTEFIAVSTAVDEGGGNYPPSAWFNDENFNSPVLIDDANATLLGGFGFTGFPAFVAIDADGTIVARAGGNIGVEGFEALLENFAS